MGAGAACVKGAEIASSCRSRNYRVKRAGITELKEQELQELQEQELQEQELQEQELQELVTASLVRLPSCCPAWAAALLPWPLSELRRLVFCILYSVFCILYSVSCRGIVCGTDKFRETQIYTVIHCLWN